MSSKITPFFLLGICLFLFLTICQRSIAQIPTNCFAIQGILVDACGTQEGENEMVSMQIGPNNLNVSNMTATWPPSTNPWRGICQDATTATKVAAFNRRILGCGWLVEPVAGVLPAGKKVLLFCSEAVDTTLTSFANLQDTVVAIFQCVGNTSGHFKNYPSGTTPSRSMSISFSSPVGCTETVAYIPDSLRDGSGTHVAADGEGVHFSNTGVASYYWNPCMPPVISPFVHGGSNISICRNTTIVHLQGTADNNQSLHWYGGHGIFGRTDTTITTYTPSPLDAFPLYLYLEKRICPNDSIVDSVRVSLAPPPAINISTHICGGQSYTVGSHVYTANGLYADTLLSSGGCDSIIITNLRVDTTITRVVNLNGCHQVTYNGVVHTSDTTIHENYTYVSGCDSLVQVIVITISNATRYYQSPTICQGQTVQVGFNSYASSGLYIDTFHTSGCDSIVQTLLTVIVPYPDILVLNFACSGTFNGVTYTSGASFLDTIHSYATGCDSVYLSVTVNVSVPGVATSTQNVTICPGSSFFAGGQYQTTAGTYRDTTRYTSGCDSAIAVTNLSLLHPRNIYARYDTCSSITIDGISYHSDTVVTSTIIASIGCDSIIETDTVHIKGTNISILSSALLPIAQGDSTQLIINPTGNYQNIVWSPNQWINNRYLAAPTVLPDVSTAYSVNATDINGCPVSAQLIVTVTSSNLPEFVMPDAFTPNGDGKNDSIGPILNPTAQLNVFHIYNRWGELVFDKDQSGSNTWNGTYKGVQQPAGNYMYFVTVTPSLGAATVKEGNITLFR